MVGGPTVQVHINGCFLGACRMKCLSSLVLENGPGDLQAGGFVEGTRNKVFVLGTRVLREKSENWSERNVEL